MRSTRLLLLAAALGTGCGSTSYVVSPDEFDRTCLQDADCISVRVGDLCGCGCEMAGISSSEEQKYIARASAASCGGSRCFPNCVAREAYCASGTCAVR
jgi:hypothetical protein